MPDFVERRDLSFKAQAARFTDYCAAHAAELGLSPADAAEIAAAKAEFEADLTAHSQARAAAKGARSKKDSSRAPYERLFRRLAARIQANSAVTDSTRAMMGLHVHDTTRTRTPPPATSPQLGVDVHERLAHRVRFWDEESQRRGKPAGAVTMQLWRTILEPGGAEGHKEFVHSASRSPVRVEYDGSAAGKAVRYEGRWVNRRGETGPWSAAVTETVLG